MDFTRNIIFSCPYCIYKFKHYTFVLISDEMCSPQSALRDTMLRITGVITGLLSQNEGFEMLDGLIFQCELLYRYRVSMNE